MKMAIKKFMKNIVKGVDVAEDELNTLYKVIDKACKVGVLKKQTAARRKSRVVKAYNDSKKQK
jgi:small subunit ribosomal protein S20